MDFARSLDRVRKHTSIVQRMEFALRSDPTNAKLALGIGSARRRAKRSEEEFAAMAEQKQVDLIRYRLVNESDFYAVEAVADSSRAFQRSFTSIADFLDSGAKQKARISKAIEDKSRLNLAYTFPGSMGLVLSVEASRNNLFNESELDGVADVFKQFIEVEGEESAIDASRNLGSALVTQLCKWVDVNAQWESSVDFLFKRGDGQFKGQYIEKNRFFDLHDIFHRAKDIEPHNFSVTGILVGIDINDRRFHFVKPDGDDFKGKLSNDFGSNPTTVGNRYTAEIDEEVSRVVATGKETRIQTLKSLTPIE